MCIKKTDLKNPTPLTQSMDDKMTCLKGCNSVNSLVHRQNLGAGCEHSSCEREFFRPVLSTSPNSTVQKGGGSGAGTVTIAVVVVIAIGAVGVGIYFFMNKKPASRRIRKRNLVTKKV